MASKKESKDSKSEAPKSALDLMRSLQKEKKVRHIPLRSIRPTDFLSFGCLSADLITGGGFLGNEVTQIFGPAGVGKSSTGYMATGSVVRHNVPCQMHDHEGTTKKDYREKLSRISGDQEEYWQYLRPQHGPESYDLIHSLLKQLPDKDEGLPQACFFIDSVAMMPTQNEMEDWSKDKRLAQRATMHSEWWPRIKGLLARKHVAMVAINQIKANPGPFGGIVRPGGNAWEFNTDNLIQVSGSKGRIEVDGDTYQDLTFKTWKNKHYGSAHECTVFLHLGHGIDPASDVIQFLKLVGMYELVQNGRKKVPLITGLDKYANGAKLDKQYAHVKGLSDLIKQQATSSDPKEQTFVQACRGMLLSGEAVKLWETARRAKAGAEAEGEEDDAAAPSAPESEETPTSTPSAEMTAAEEEAAVAKLGKRNKRNAEALQKETPA